MAALTPEAIWIQDTWQLQSIPLQNLGIERQRYGKELVLTLGPEPVTEKLTLTFANASQGERWCREVEGRQRRLTHDALPSDRQPPEGVALVQQAPEVSHVSLGRVEFTGQSQWAADRGLQLRAGIRGANAILELERQKCPEMGWGARRVSGLAVRVEDAEAQKRLRLRWYGEEVGSLIKRSLLLLLLQGVVLLLATLFCAGMSHVHEATGETPAQALTSAGQGMAMLYAWPLVLLALLWALRWPQLLPSVGLAVLAATTGRGLTVWVAHLLAAQTTGGPLAQSQIWMLLDPVDWAFVIIGMRLCVRAWRLAGAARQILPQELQAVPTLRKAWSRGPLAATGVYALVLLGFVGTFRYQTSAHLLQPGADPRREHEALLSLNEGAAQANKGQLGAAEQSFQHALGLWEKLTARRPHPSVYRRNLAQTLYNLGWVREQQGRFEEAEQYYARALALADELAGDPQLDDVLKQNLADARQALADQRGGKAFKLMEEKDEAAARKYEEAVVKDQKGEVEAERLYREAITLWEEVLPQATNEDYRKTAVARLALAYLHVGRLQQEQGKHPGAEAALKKAIDYGEKAVALDPERLLAKHNLEMARQKLEALRNQALQEEVNKLCQAERFADASDLWLRSIEEEAEGARSGKDRDAAVRRLAYRLEKFAWFLAHCPDGHIRDTKAAVKHARRATELQADVGDHWYTLAMVQYRNGDWRDSLATLEKVKAREGELDASAWFLSAMDLHQLKRRGEARAALRKGDEWIAERKRQAEDNTLLRLQFEMMRPAIEALRREAENLIEGKDPADTAVG
jgi:tetratricopeptide (TPR) repeat protein